MRLWQRRADNSSGWIEALHNTNAEALCDLLSQIEKRTLYLEASSLAMSEKQRAAAMRSLKKTHNLARNLVSHVYLSERQRAELYHRMISVGELVNEVASCTSRVA
jgi:hypothetical protein